MQYDYRQEGSERCVKAMKKSGKLVIALAGVILGVLLLLIGNRAREEGSTAAAPPVTTETKSAETYREELEARMEAICAQVAGAGVVDVIVTLDGGYEYVYASDKKLTSGGESVSYVTVGSGDNESLVYISERAPGIVGIGVVCSGGMDASVRREITGLLSAAFGVGSNKIYVTGRK